MRGRPELPSAPQAMLYAAPPSEAGFACSRSHVADAMIGIYYMRLQVIRY